MDTERQRTAQGAGDEQERAQTNPQSRSPEESSNGCECQGEGDRANEGWMDGEREEGTRGAQQREKGARNGRGRPRAFSLRRQARRPSQLRHNRMITLMHRTHHHQISGEHSGACPFHPASMRRACWERRSASVADGSSPLAPRSPPRLLSLCSCSDRRRCVAIRPPLDRPRASPHCAQATVVASAANTAIAAQRRSERMETNDAPLWRPRSRPSDVSCSRHRIAPRWAHRSIVRSRPKLAIHLASSPHAPHRIAMSSSWNLKHMLAKRTCAIAAL